MTSSWSLLAHGPVGEVALDQHRAVSVTHLEGTVPGHQALALAIGELGVEAERRVQRRVHQRTAGAVEDEDPEVLASRLVSEQGRAVIARLAPGEHGQAQGQREHGDEAAKSGH